MALHEFYPGEVDDTTFAETVAWLSGQGPVDVTLASDGGPWAVHNMPCPVCVDNKAIVHLGPGGFGPCGKCQQQGWELRRRKPARRRRPWRRR